MEKKKKRYLISRQDVNMATISHFISKNFKEGYHDGVLEKLLSGKRYAKVVFFNVYGSRKVGLMSHRENGPAVTDGYGTSWYLASSKPRSFDNYFFAFTEK